MAVWPGFRATGPDAALAHNDNSGPAPSRSDWIELVGGNVTSLQFSFGSYSTKNPPTFDHPVWFMVSWNRLDDTAVSGYHRANGIYSPLTTIWSIDTTLSPVFLTPAAPQAKPSVALVCTHNFAPSTEIASV